MAGYAISGGLQSWVPAIIKDSYGLSDALSIFMSMFLPLFGLVATFLTPYLYKKLKNYIVLSFLAFVVGAILITGVVLCLDIHWLPVMILFVLVRITMGVVSNMTTVMVPLNFKGKFNAGFLAGFLNGSSYLGMAISTYVLGAMVDIVGWKGAIIFLLAIAAFSAVLGLIYLFFSFIFQKKKGKDTENVDNVM